MRILPILFNTDMVRAILDGRKTVTRRLVKVPPYYPYFYKLYINTDGAITSTRNRLYAGFYREEQIFYIDGERHVDAVYYQAPYQSGDILYVRETWHKYKKRIGKGEGCHIAEFYGYKASIANSEDADEPWKPSIHMPKEAARIWLKVKDVRVERLQEITEDGAKNEGARQCYEVIDTLENRPVTYLAEDRQGYYILGFKQIWNSTIKKSDLDRYGWDASPWVWVIEFERCEKPENM